LYLSVVTNFTSSHRQNTLKMLA